MTETIRKELVNLSLHITQIADMMSTSTDKCAAMQAQELKYMAIHALCWANGYREVPEKL